MSNPIAKRFWRQGAPSTDLHATVSSVRASPMSAKLHVLLFAAQTETLPCRAHTLPVAHSVGTNPFADEAVWQPMKLRLLEPTLMLIFFSSIMRFVASPSMCALDWIVIGKKPWA